MIQSLKQKVLTMAKRILQPKVAAVLVFIVAVISILMVYHMYFEYDEYRIIPSSLGQELYENAFSEEVLTLTAANADFKFSYNKDRDITFYIRKKDIRKAQQYEALIILIVQKFSEANRSV